MNRKQKKWKHVLLTLVLAMLCVAGFNIFSMNRILLDEAQVMGTEIAKRLAAQEMHNIVQYQWVLDTLEASMRPQNRTEDTAAWMQEYLVYARDLTGLDEIEIYASVDGKIVAATYWEGDEDYGPTASQWYQQAIEAGGGIVYTDAYIDVRLQKPVFTIAKQVRGTQDVVAMDIYSDQLGVSGIREELPEEGHYYLCDSQGQLLYYVAHGEASPEVIQEQISQLFNEIQAGEHTSYQSFTQGIDGRKRGVYYHPMENGWCSIITIPYSTLLAQSGKVWLPFAVLLGLFAAASAAYLVSQWRSRKSAALYNSIVGVLSNSYYALYQVDLNQGTYEMLKGSDYVRENAGNAGDYALLLQKLAEVIEPEAYEEFSGCFDIENMRQLMKKRVRNYGGDFKRLFNGRYRWVHVQMLYDESLQPGKVVLCFRDVHEEKEHDLARMELLQNSIHSVTEMADSKNRFFSCMSHDMRTPLNAILGLTRLAEDQVDQPDKIRAALGKVRAAGEQLLGLINDILEISKLEEGKLDIVHQPFDLAENLRQTAELFSLQDGGQRTFRWKTDLRDTAVEGDWRRLQQILNNLLSNAFKYTKPGDSIDFEVTEFADTQSRYPNFRFVVRDTGAGMSKEFLGRLFVPFEREVRFGAANVAGTGLGMPIVHDLVRQMEGRIEVESALGKGTTVTVTLPLRLAEERRPEETPPSYEPADMTGKRVLLAEDNEINMEIACAVLEMHHLEVTQAWDGRQALELFENSEPGHFDAVLMDMQMPVMDGCAAARAIRALHRPDAATVPIIAVTANAFSEDIARPQQAGMNAHISKPIDFNVLEQVLGRLLAAPSNRQESEP
ncbi:ATP-binding protein [Ruthenibacterium sp. CLA-JM-H11]|uniref:Stage 0 sporulation protein A homolog n=1 Tax=Ruthenibacterium intestinale TaxID=3133163 RepID=A0ABV1GDU1_9FIRM